MQSIGKKEKYSESYGRLGFPGSLCLLIKAAFKGQLFKQES
jgi:hypothetical protein